MEVVKADKLTKHFCIGEMEFDVAINRDMATKAFKKAPALFNCILKAGSISNKELEDLSLEEYLKLEEVAQKRKESYPILTDYILDEMLEFAETDLKDYKGYFEYSGAIINYCKENDIYEDYCLEENGEIIDVQGFCSLIGDFIALGFTQGNTQKKKTSKMKIIN